MGMRQRRLRDWECGLFTGTIGAGLAAKPDGE